MVFDSGKSMSFLKIPGGPKIFRFGIIRPHTRILRLFSGGSAPSFRSLTHVWLRYMTSPEATMLKEFLPRPTRGQCPSRWSKTPTRDTLGSRRRVSQGPKSTRTNWSKTGPGRNRPKSGNRNRPKSIPDGRSRAGTRSSAIPGPARSVLD